MKGEEPHPPTPFPEKRGGERENARFVVRGQRVAGEKKQRAREFRREMTPAERVLWELVRANRLGYHFRRQQVIDGYIADFYCHAAALAVEVDGDVHDGQIEYDERRTAAFSMRGIRVIRFRNEEVSADGRAVVARIVSACAEPHPPAPSPEKRGGERHTAVSAAENTVPSENAEGEKRQATAGEGEGSSVESPSLLRGGVGEGFFA